MKHLFTYNESKDQRFSEWIQVDVEEMLEFMDHTWGEGTLKTTFEKNSKGGWVLIIKFYHNNYVISKTNSFSDQQIQVLSDVTQYMFDRGYPKWFCYSYPIEGEFSFQRGPVYRSIQNYSSGISLENLQELKKWKLADNYPFYMGFFKIENVA